MESKKKLSTKKRQWQNIQKVENIHLHMKKLILKKFSKFFNLFFLITALILSF